MHSDFTSLMAVRDRWIVAAMIFGGFTLIIVGSAGQDYLYGSMQSGNAKPFVEEAVWPALYWYTWALLAPVVFWIASTFRVTGRHRWRNLGLLLLGCGALYAVHVGLQIAYMALPRYEGLHATWSSAMAFHAYSSIQTNAVAYWVLVGAWYAGNYYRTSRAQAIQNATLESQLARAELQALKMQIHPHFLFNTLHGIAETMYRDVSAADRMVTDLSDLLRTSIDRSDAAFVPLDEEIAFARRYLAIEQARFEDRLRVEIDVAEGAGDAMVPSFILQPFVENAVKHGVATHSNAARIIVEASTRGDCVELTVRDERTDDHRIASPDEGTLATSFDRAQTNGDGGGVGIENVVRRLDWLFGDAYELRLSQREDGFIVNLRVPIHHEAARSE